jgi:putative ABC transport system ATP-binding protein
MELLAVKDLKKDIENGDVKLEILKNINLTISEKEYVAIMGRSGSGKSTLLGILAGLDTLTSGNVTIAGTDISKLSDNKLTDFRNENIGIIFQSFNLIPTLTAIENIEVPIFFSKKKIDIKKRALELLDLVGLKDKANTLPRQLSGGEQQRVAIARALATEPKILFADEPTGALDSKNGELILSILKDFRNKYNMSIIMVTHDKNIANEADRILYLKDGILGEVDSYNA